MPRRASIDPARALRHSRPLPTPPQASVPTDPQPPHSPADSGVHTGARVRVLLGQEVAIGPAKADVLEQIRATGSIAAAGRHLGMGYKRVWLLVDTMNRCFAHPWSKPARTARAAAPA